MAELALYGGRSVVKEPIPSVYHATIGQEERTAVLDVMEKGVLSDFLGRAGEKFYGGFYVRRFEKAFQEKFGVKHAISMNSATSALHASIAALGIGPGDEVITSPYTMPATATAILMNGAIPVFADIDENTFCISPASVKERITANTKAILVVNLFGGLPDFDELKKIAADHNLYIVEDNAQASGACYKGKAAGTIGDIGVFSLNVHKSIQAGEGGVLVTNDDKLAFRAALARNHAEAVVDDLQERRKQGSSVQWADEILIGNNYRMSELHAAIGYEQLKKLDFLNERRITLATYLAEQLQHIEGLTPAYVPEGVKHVYYVYPIKFDAAFLGISRFEFARAMAAEGFPVAVAYQKPIYLLPLYQRKTAYNQTQFPWDSKHYSGSVDYSKGSCPVAERMYERELIFHVHCQYPLTKQHIDLFVTALKKVLRCKNEIIQRRR